MQTTLQPTTLQPTQPSPAAQPETCLEGSEARVFLQPDGTAVRKLRRRSAAAGLRAPQQLLNISRHPNVVRIFAVDSATGDICMEAMAVSLQRHVRQQHAPLPFPPKLHSAASVAQGLRPLHAHGMDHGDLCPANVLLAWPAGTSNRPHAEMRVNLCDFYNARTGTARAAAYAAPEVVTSPPTTPTHGCSSTAATMCAADVWAFACCLLFLEGAQPFRGFDEDPAVLFYLGLHGCVAFRENGECKPFLLAACAYGPARHIGRTPWAGILARAFLPEPRRLSSQELCAALLKLQVVQAPHTPQATHAPRTHTPPKTHARPPLKRLNFK
jgi:serine/threonine protein kinase